MLFGHVVVHPVAVPYDPVIRDHSAALERVFTQLASELGRPVRCVGVLGRPRRNGAVWAAEAAELGDVVVKVWWGRRPADQTRWRARHLPLLTARGFPAPQVIWHGPVGGEDYAVVEERLPGAPLRTIDGTTLDALLDLVELQADAGIDGSERDIAAYQTKVLFDGWGQVWRDAEGASPDAKRLCSRLRGWLEPVWGHRIEARDFANHDLALSNVLADGARITGIVDWDEFGLNTRAADLTALAFDFELRRLDDAVAALLQHIVEIAGEDDLRCLVAYRAIGRLATRGRLRRHEAVARLVAVAGRLLDCLDAD